MTARSFVLVASIALAPLALPAENRPAPSPTAPAPVARRFAAEAERVLDRTVVTTYRHRTRVDAAAGIYELDCSGLIAFLLRKVSEPHLRAVPVAPGRKKPRAVEYCEFFRVQPAAPESPTGWLRVRTFADAQSGDVLAWRYPERAPGQNTGHVVIIAEPPERIGDDVFKVAVMDSTERPHDQDTRSRGATGLGRGVMYFRVNERGELAAYRRSSGEPWRGGNPIEIGRLVDLPSR